MTTAAVIREIVQEGKYGLENFLLLPSPVTITGQSPVMGAQIHCSLHCQELVEELDKKE